MSPILNLNHSEKQLKKEDTMAQRIIGTVKWFDKVKGYGFITYEDEEPDIFVHSSALQTQGVRYLEEGDRVEFTIEQTPRGLHAGNVKKLEAIKQQKGPRPSR
jgi:cold shock protein